MNHSKGKAHDNDDNEPSSHKRKNKKCKGGEFIGEVDCFG